MLRVFDFHGFGYFDHCSQLESLYGLLIKLFTVFMPLINLGNALYSDSAWSSLYEWAIKFLASIISKNSDSSLIRSKLKASLNTCLGETARIPWISSKCVFNVFLYGRPRHFFLILKKKIYIYNHSSFFFFFFIKWGG